MIGFMESNLLRFEGLTDQDITDVNAIIPDLQNLILIIQKHQDQFNRVMKVLLPVVQKVLDKQKELS